MKKRTLINLTLFPVVLAAILVISLLTLDLNPYRDQVVWSLEQAFSRPVKLGSLELTLHGGLALELHDLQVGSDEEANHFRTGKALFKPRLLELLHGRLTFDKIELEKPSLQITLPHSEGDEEEPDSSPPNTAPLFANLPGLKRLKLLEADVVVRNVSATIPQLSLQSLNLTMEGFHPGETGQITLSGNLGESANNLTPLSLSGRVQIPQASENWLGQLLDIKLAVREVKRENWQELLPQTLTGMFPDTPFDLYLDLNSSEDGKMSATVTLESSDKRQPCLPPNLTLNITDATLSGNYARRSPAYDLLLEGQGQLERCGTEMATFTLHQKLSGSPEQTEIESRIDAQLDTAALTTWLPPKQKGLRAEGRMPLTVELAGNSKKLDWAVRGKLDKVALFRNNLMLKTPGIPGRLRAQGELGTGRKLTAGQIKLGDLQVNLSGTYTNNSQTVELQLPPFEISRLEETLPALAQWDLRGTLSGNYRFHKSVQGWQSDGLFDLSGVAASHPYPLGAVQQTTAQLKFHNHQLYFTCSPLGLGESQLFVTGTIADLRKPVFEIHAETPAMLARDLVFKRPGVHLNDLAGDLRIDGSGMEFIDARVRLDSGTRAEVDGHLDFHTHRLYLNARASYGHIDEVIQLFSGPARWNDAEQQEQSAHHQGPHLKVIVDAEAQKGEIGDVSFEQARGTVTVGNGKVEVYPLTFSGQGQGTATARVDYQSRAEKVGWLRVSGHLNQFDSSTIYQQYWKQEGVLRGPLDADFFFQGPCDNQFFARGDGAAYLEITDGTLRKFNAISKAFSLLNVSQLVKGDLPDISGHGMKFKLAKGTLSFGGDYVYFDDLAIFSNSLNMSMVGRVGITSQEADYILGVQPLQTVDKVVSKIPVVGWLLTGDEKTLFTVHFQVKGPLGDPSVVAIPGSSLGSGILGIFQRTLQLPGKLVK
ncbi:MAG: hypothetical protein C0624_12545 [Desulfuromonas sp.]|nr:MAG: hypothetical protein C0624_12545 [Desulfuromonas sp.]